MTTLQLVLSALAGLLPATAGAVAFLAAHPAQAAGIDLGAALGLDWLSAVALAALSGTFDRNRLAGILRSQLATTEARAIAGLLVAGVAAHLGSLTDLGNGLTLAAAGAAALYSAPTWADVQARVRTIIGRFLPDFPLAIAPAPAAAATH